MSSGHRARRFPALRHRDFRLYWSGGAFNAVGTQFTTVAMAWQIYELTNSALQIGLLGLARGLPQMALLLLGGMLADAVDRRKLMMSTQAAQLGISVLLFVTTVTGAMSPTVLYIAAVLLAVTSALEGPVRNVLVPNLVPREDLTNALALHNAQRNFGQVAGPGLAGLGLAAAGPAFCHGVNLLSWFAMLGALMLIKARPDAGSGRHGMTLQAFREGITLVWSHPVLLTILVVDFGVNIFGSPRGLFPIFARDILEVGPQGLGMLYSSTAVGSLIAGMMMSVRAEPRRAGVGIIVSLAAFGLANALFSVSHHFWLSVLLLALAGAGDSVAAILRSTVNQLLTPNDLRGRVTSVNSVFTNGGPQLSQFRAGMVASWWGAEVSGLIGGLGALVIALAVLARPQLRNLEIVQGEVAHRSHASPSDSTSRSVR